MNEPGTVEPRQLLRPGVVAAVAVGIAVGGLAGATMRGSGSIYTSLLVGGCLLLILALAVLGALAAARTRRASAARLLAGFAGLAVIAAGVSYSIAPPYRSPDADIEHPGSVTVHVAEPAAFEWGARASCRTRPHAPTVFTVFAQDVALGDRWVAVLLHLGSGAPPLQLELTISFSSPTAGSGDYIASSGNGLDATQVGADGLAGSLRFSADRVPNPHRSPGPEGDRLTGTLEWACEAAPSG